MKSFLFFILALATYVFSIDITISKDSIKVYNDLFSSRSDGIIIKNNSEDTISLDSAYLIFDVFDTSGMSMYLTNNRKLEAFWLESNNGDFSWYLNEIGTNKYKLIKNFFGPGNKPIPVFCPPKDSCFFNDFRIGIFLIGSERPVFPKYVKGNLHLFFTNNENIQINFYSDNFSNLIVSKICRTRELKTNHIHGYFSLNGKQIKHINKKHNKIYPIKLIQ
jgi:hypothetical protein